MKNELKILDCTLRDGGYYNQWDFEASTVNKYINAMIDSKIDYVEIGFRNFSQNHFLGPYAYSTDKFLSNIKNIEKLNLAVMSDAVIFLNDKKNIKKSVQQLYDNKKNSPISLVRIATHYKDVEEAAEIMSTLKELGYLVALNLMQTGGKTAKEIESVVKLIASWNTVDTLYFADSLGNMDNNEVVNIVKTLNTFWNKDIGIHTHNNKGNAISNSLVALNHGVTWVDSTVQGMGRGAGNGATEDLLRELNKSNGDYYSLQNLYKLALEEFSILKKRYQWGHSLLYSLAADYSIHPTYIQEMISDKKYSNNEIIQIIESMKDIPTKSYNKDILERLKSKSSEKTKAVSSQGTWDATNWCSGKEVLLIGSGPSSLDYKEAIIEYIKNYKPHVLCLNINRDYDENLIDGYVTANGSRVLMESKYYLETNKPIYTSKSLFSDDPNFGHISKYIKDFGVTVTENIIKINNNHCEIPYPLSAIYALCLLSAGKAKKIYMVGFDGYEKNDNKQDNMIDAINQYKSNAKSIELVSLTPTSYPISKSSIYAPK